WLAVRSPGKHSSPSSRFQGFTSERIAMRVRPGRVGLCLGVVAFLMICQGPVALAQDPKLAGGVAGSLLPVALKPGETDDSTADDPPSGRSRSLRARWWGSGRKPKSSRSARTNGLLDAPEPAVKKTGAGKPASDVPPRPKIDKDVHPTFFQDFLLSPETRSA